jgi:hypothetical protein
MTFVRQGASFYGYQINLFGSKLSEFFNNSHAKFNNFMH